MRKGGIRAELDSGTSLAVLQQGAAFIIVVLGEGFFNRRQLPPKTKGRPSLPVTLLTSGGLFGALLLLLLGDDAAKPGLALGLLASGILLLSYIQRTLDVEYDPREFPGKKAWPGTLLLISFFSVNIFAQALFKATQI